MAYIRYHDVVIREAIKFMFLYSQYLAVGMVIIEGWSHPWWQISCISVSLYRVPPLMSLSRDGHR